MRGQVSIEYVMIIGFSLLILIPAIISGITTTQLSEQQVTERQLERIAFEVTQTADALAFEGPPAKRTIRTYIPAGVENITTLGPMLVITYRAGPADRTVLLSSEYANLTWNAGIPGEGYRNLVLEAKPTEVEIR